MAYNEKLAERLRHAVSGTKHVVEKKMFGGIALMINDRMCVGVYKNDIILRCEPERTDDLLSKRGARPFDLSGKKPSPGWLLVSAEGWTDKKAFGFWIKTAIEANKKATASKRKK